MTANNSCGARSIRYGNMVHNVRAIDGVLADGTLAHFGAHGRAWRQRAASSGARSLAIVEREAGEIERRFPKVLRRVGGYNLDLIAPRNDINLAHLLVGSEGTLAFSTKIDLGSRRLSAAAPSAPAISAPSPARWMRPSIS